MLRAVRGGQPMEREYIGIDLHKQFFQACAVTPTGIRVWEQRFPRTDGGLVLFRERCTSMTAIAVEATGPTWAFVDALRPSGATVCVVDPRKTRLKAAYAAKTDRLDVRVDSRTPCAERAWSVSTCRHPRCGSCARS